MKWKVEDNDKIDLREDNDNIVFKKDDDDIDLRKGNNNGISEEDIIGIEEDHYAENNNDNCESDNDDNIYEEDSIVDTIDINQMSNINESASYFENSTSILLFY
ncbi:6839_t:CDS:2 [Funneliformis caledonium]|uniref:6839_t:CDS:1 n=1 Tax=Funneliformis caledonium TaxID=1117310 RepID=A0A9N9DBN3_9GLOM|nr:6839_t:CDS:2 [Funneliformis caledonium]